VGDAEEPRRKRHLPPAEAADRAEHLEEDLFGQILRFGRIADARHHVAIDAGHVPIVDVGQGLLVARPGAIDRRPLEVGRNGLKGRELHARNLVSERSHRGYGTRWFPKASTRQSDTSVRTTP
jgi:hypothetical protein